VDGIDVREDPLERPRHDLRSQDARHRVSAAEDRADLLVAVPRGLGQLALPPGEPGDELGEEHAEFVGVDVRGRVEERALGIQEGDGGNGARVVAVVDVGRPVDVHPDRDEFRRRLARDLRIREGFSVHDARPRAPRGAEGQEDGAAGFAGAAEGFLVPVGPGDRHES
jgi:hypothetical protein